MEIALWYVFCILAALAFLFSGFSLVIASRVERKLIDVTQFSKRLDACQSDLTDFIDKVSRWRNRDAVRKFRDKDDDAQPIQEPLPMTPEDEKTRLRRLAFGKQ